MNNDHRQGCKHLTQAVCTVGREVTLSTGGFLCDGVPYLDSENFS